MQNHRAVLTIDAREIPVNAILTLCYARSMHVNADIHILKRKDPIRSI